jgi:hypothetical protein
MLLVGRIVEMLCVYFFYVLVIVQHLILLAELGSWFNCVRYSGLKLVDGINIEDSDRS